MAVSEEIPTRKLLANGWFSWGWVGIRQGFCGGTLASILFAAALKVLFTLKRVDLWGWFKLTWLVLGGDPAARSHRVEQFTAL